jgi:hypothetical protein
MGWDWDYTSQEQLSCSIGVKWELKVIQGKDQRFGSPSHSLMKLKRGSNFHSCVHYHRPGKRERHVHKMNQTLAQHLVPTLDMSGFSGLSR